MAKKQQRLKLSRKSGDSNKFGPSSPNILRHPLS